MHTRQQNIQMLGALNGSKKMFRCKKRNRQLQIENFFGETCKL